MKKQMTDKQLRVRTQVHVGEQDPFAWCKKMPADYPKCDCEFEVREEQGVSDTDNTAEYVRCMKSF